MMEEKEEGMEIMEIGRTDFSHRKRKNFLFLEEMENKQDFSLDRLPYDIKLTLDEALLLEVYSERKWRKIFKAGDLFYERSERGDGLNIGGRWLINRRRKT